MARWEVTKVCAEQVDWKKDGANYYMETVEACGNKENRAKDSISDSEVSVVVFVKLGECEGDPESYGKK